MKKQYIIPDTTAIYCMAESIICASGEAPKPKFKYGTPSDKVGL